MFEIPFPGVTGENSTNVLVRLVMTYVELTFGTKKQVKVEGKWNVWDWKPVRVGDAQGAAHPTIRHAFFNMPAMHYAAVVGGHIMAIRELSRKEMRMAALEAAKLAADAYRLDSRYTDGIIDAVEHVESDRPKPVHCSQAATVVRVETPDAGWYATSGLTKPHHQAMMAVKHAIEAAWFDSPHDVCSALQYAEWAGINIGPIWQKIEASLSEAPPAEE